MDQDLKKSLEPFRHCRVDEAFWDEPNLFSEKVPNNIILKKMRYFYLIHETDEEMKEYFLPFLEWFICMYVTVPEMRMRIGWMFWWVVIYVQDKQFIEEEKSRFQLEIWTDPRVWKEHSQKLREAQANVGQEGKSDNPPS